MKQYCKISTCLAAGSVGMKISSEGAAAQPKNHTSGSPAAAESEVQKQIRKINAGEAQLADLFSAICEKNKTPCQDFVKNALKIKGQKYETTTCTFDEFNNLFIDLIKTHNSGLPKEEHLREDLLTTVNIFEDEDDGATPVSSSQVDGATPIPLDDFLKVIVEDIAWPHIETVLAPSIQTGNSNFTGPGVPVSVMSLYMLPSVEDCWKELFVTPHEIEDLCEFLQSGEPSQEGIGRTVFTRPNGGSVEMENETSELTHSWRERKLALINKEEKIPKKLKVRLLPNSVCRDPEYYQWAKFCLPEYLSEHPKYRKDWKRHYEPWLTANNKAEEQKQYVQKRLELEFQSDSEADSDSDEYD